MAEVTLNLVVIRSADPERTVQFYRALGLSFTKERHGVGPEHFACQLGSAVFEIYPCVGDCSYSAETRLGFRVPALDDLLVQLAMQGAVISSPPKQTPWGRRVTVVDPDGHRVEITE